MKQTIIIIGLAVIVVTAFLWYRSCNNSQSAYWEEQYNEMVKVNELATSQYLNEISALQENIVDKDKEISALNNDIQNVYNQLQNVDDNLLTLEEEFTQLGADKDAKIKNLQQQITIWKQKFTLAESIIADKDEIIFSLQAKYDAQVRISDNYRSLYEGELAINDVLKKNLSVLTKKHKVNSMVDKIKNAMIISAAGYILYDVVKD